MRSQKLLVGLFLLALVGALGWLAWKAGGETDSPTPNWAQGPASDSGSIDGLRASGGTAAEAGVESGDPDARIERQSISSRADEGAPETLLIQVLEEMNSEPIADASVRFFTEEGLRGLSPAERNLLNRHLDRRDFDAAFEKFGSSAKTDRRGLVEIPVPVCKATRRPSMFWLRSYGPDLDVVADGWHGEGYINTLEVDVIDVWVRRDHTLRFHTVHEDGRVAPEVDVRLTASRMSGSRTYTFRTGPDGHGAIPHVLRYRIWNDQITELTAAIPGLEESPRVLVDLRAAPHVSVEIVIPSTGRVVVRVEGLEGRPEAERAIVALRAHDADGAWRVSQNRRAPEDGRATFEHVIPGTRVDATLRVNNQTLDQTTIDGPAHAGETVTATLSLDAAVCVTARVLDTEGRPVRGEKLVAQWAREDGTDRSVASTDDDGNGRWLYPAGDGTIAPDTFRLRSLDCPPPSANARVTSLLGGLATPRISVAGASGVVDVGTLQLRDLPLLARVRVVDPSDRPLPVGAIFPHAVGVSGTPALLGLRRLGVGVFEVRDESVAVELRLSVHGDGWSEQQTCAVGDLDVVIRRTLLGTLRATVRHPDLDQIEPHLLLHSASNEERVRGPHDSSQLHQGSTTFEWTRLPPGRYRLVGTVDGQSRPFCEVNDIVIEGGENHDPRLDALELSDVAHLTLMFRNADGGPIRDLLTGMLFIRESGAAHRWSGRGFFSIKPNLTLTLPAGPHDLRICPRGSQPIELFGMEGSAVVKLRPNIETSVVLEVDGDIDPMPYLRCRLQHSAPPGVEISTVFGDADELAVGFSGYTEWVSLEPGTPAVLRAPGVGTYDLHIESSRLRHVPDEERRPVEGFAPAQISVGDTAPGEPVSIRVPASALQ